MIDSRLHRLECQLTLWRWTMVGTEIIYLIAL